MILPQHVETVVTNPSSQKEAKQPQSRGEIPFEWLGKPTKIERKEEIIAGVIGAGEIVVIHADPKVGKTQLAAYTSFAISTGQPWFGRAVKAGAVLYLALEKAKVTRKRFRAMQRLNNNIEPAIAVSAASVDLTRDQDVTAVVAAAKAMEASGGPVRLIVFDTLNRAFGGEDENAAGVVGRAFNALTRIAIATNASIVLLHHNSKNSQRLRGSTAIVASADVVISLSKDDGEDRLAEVTSANDAVEGQKFRFRMPIYELEPATSTYPAEITVLIEPIEDGGCDGRARRSAPVGPSMADIHRSNGLKSLFDQLSINGQCARRELLSACRDQHIVSPNNPKSGAEQFRKALIALKKDGSLDYDEDTIWTQHRPSPNAQQPNAS
jgi:hypothetical protein